MANKKYENIDEYIDSFPKESQLVLKKISQTIKKAEPKLTEGISYGIPTFYLYGKYSVYFAGYKNHFSIYPATTEAAEKAGLSDYKVSKGTLKFLASKPIPYEKIAKFVKIRVNEVK